MINKKILSTSENNKNYYINQLIKSGEVDYDINKYLNHYNKVDILINGKQNNLIEN